MCGNIVMWQEIIDTQPISFNCTSLSSSTVQGISQGHQNDDIKSFEFNICPTLFFFLPPNDKLIAHNSMSDHQTRAVLSNCLLSKGKVGSTHYDDNCDPA